MTTFAVRLVRIGQPPLHVYLVQPEDVREQLAPSTWVDWTPNPDRAASYDWPTAMYVARIARRALGSQVPDDAVTVEPIKPVTP